MTESDLAQLWPELTETERYYVVLIERMRGSSAKKMEQMLNREWKEFAAPWAETSKYGALFRRKRLIASSKIYLYMDLAIQQGDAAFGPGLLADVFGIEVAEAEEIVDLWWWEVENHKHFPIPCKLCDMRGSWYNPIMENGNCLYCNAREQEWPLERWCEGGQMIELLFGWGLISEDEVADWVKENACGDQ